MKQTDGIPPKMRALIVQQYGPIASLAISTLPMPLPGPGQVRVRVVATGLGFVDGLKVQGLYQTKDPLPFVPGMEYAGTIDALGESVKAREVGERVFGMTARGALAEYLLAQAGEVHAIPDRLNFAQAAAVPVNYLTASYALGEIAALLKGENLLVLGAAGGTGMAAIQVGKLLGAHVIAAASSPEKRAAALAAGADSAVDYTLPDWRDTVKTLSGGKGIHVIFDGVGGDIGPVAFRTLAWRGRHLVIGFAAGKIPALPFNIALLKGASLMGVDSAQIRKWEPQAYQRAFERVIAGFNSGQLASPPVTSIAFDDVRSAFEAMAERRAVGKLVVSF
jgi:NADPH:quinone reductase